MIFLSNKKKNSQNDTRQYPNLANASSQEVSIEQKKEYAYGLDGLARIIGCSKSHASKLKGEGLFDDAIVQNGRKIIIDKEKALELFNKKYY
jgi:hypothetical protein